MTSSSRCPDLDLTSKVLWNSRIQLRLQNESEQISLSQMNVFQVRGMAFIPDNKKPGIDRESDALTYSWVNLCRRKILGGNMATLCIYVNYSYV
jgi:hypothetical protein